MKRANLVVAMLAALPAAALAQVTYYEAPLSRGGLEECMQRDLGVRERKAVLDDERIGTERESAAIAREGLALAQELRVLDAGNVSMVSSYNARSDAHNRRVAEHNRRVADLNARTALLNGDAADTNASCAARGYLLRDRDAIVYERSTIR